MPAFAVFSIGMCAAYVLAAVVYAVSIIAAVRFIYLAAVVTDVIRRASVAVLHYAVLSLCRASISYIKAFRNDAE